MDRTSGPVGPLWVALAIVMAVAGPAGAATIHLISAGPAGMAVDALSARLPARADAVARPRVHIYRGALLRQAAGVMRAGRCAVAAGTTLTALGAGSGARAAFGQCLVADQRSEIVVAGADAADMPAEVFATRRLADRAEAAAHPKRRTLRLHFAELLLSSAAVRVPGDAAAGLPVVPIVAGGLGEPASGAAGLGPGMPPAAPVPVPVPASGPGLLAALGLMFRTVRRPV